MHDHGALIVIEGIDGTGKTTLIENLKERLPAEDYFFTSEPYTKHCRMWLQGHNLTKEPKEAAFEFAMDRKTHTAVELMPALYHRKQNVVCDRYALSNYAYQGVMLKGIEKDPLAYIRHLHDGGWYIEPDLVILLKCYDLETIARRRENRDGGQTAEAPFLEDVQNAYYRMMVNDPDRWFAIDCSLSPVRIANRVAAEIKKCVRSRR